jgi:hypothetical protein
MLGEAADLQVTVRSDVAEGGLQFSGHQLHERRFPSAVWSHQRHPAIQIDAKINVRVQRLAIGIAEGNVVERQDWGGEVTGIGEFEIHRLFHLRLRREPPPHHLVQDLLLALRLLGVLRRAVPEPRDVLLHALDLILLPAVLLHLVLLELALRLNELVVVAVVVLELALVREMDCVRAYVVQEIL